MNKKIKLFLAKDYLDWRAQFLEQQTAGIAAALTGAKKAEVIQMTKERK